MDEIEATIQRLEEAEPLREPVLRRVIRALRLPSGSQGLDVGCGIGLQAISLARAVGPAGHVTGLDISPGLLRRAAELVETAGLSGRISFREGDMARLPFDADCFDWVWSADCVGYPVGEVASVLREMSRVVRAGGRVAILAWTSQQLIPGYPLLEARLNATCSAYGPYLSGVAPQAHFMRLLGSFQRAGLEDLRARTFVGDVRAPLSHSSRMALTSLFEMLWGTPQPETLPDDLEAYRRLCRPESPDFILNLSDYYAFFTYTLFLGRVA